MCMFHHYGATLDQCRPFGHTLDRDHSIQLRHSYLALTAPPRQALNLDTHGNVRPLFEAAGEAREPPLTG